MRIKSLFSLPNIVGCIYLYFGLNNIFFSQHSLLGYDLYRVPNTSFILGGNFFLLTFLDPFIWSGIFLLLAFFSFRKRMFPLDLLAAFLGLIVIVVNYLVFDHLSSDLQTAFFEKIFIIGVAQLLCLPAWCYFYCLWRYKKSVSKQIKPKGRESA